MHKSRALVSRTACAVQSHREEHLGSKQFGIPIIAPVRVTCNAETGHRKQRSQLAYRKAEALEDKQLLSNSDRMFIENRSFFPSTKGDLRQNKTYCSGCQCQ
jgi:hypothetical protein